MTDEKDRATFLQQYRDMIRYILAHRKVIRYINCLTWWTTFAGICTSTLLGIEVIMDGVDPDNQKAVYGSLAFTSAIMTCIKESPWIKRRLKAQYKLLSELRSWQSQYYMAARHYYETCDMFHIINTKIRFEEVENELMERESSEDVILGGKLTNMYARLTPDKFERQYQIKYNRVVSFIRECVAPVKHQVPPTFIKMVSSPKLTRRLSIGGNTP